MVCKEQFDGWHEELITQLSDEYTSYHDHGDPSNYNDGEYKNRLYKSRIGGNDMYDKEIYRRLCTYTAL